MSKEKRKLREIIGGEGGEGDFALNMADGNDRQKLRLKIADGWDITPERLKHYGKCLDALMNYAMGHREGQEDKAPISGRLGISCVNTMKSITAQLLAQEEINLKYDRLDKNLLTERIGIHDEKELERIREMAEATDTTFTLALSGDGYQAEAG